MVTGIITQNGKQSEIHVCKGENLLAALRAAGYLILSPCGGNGTCGKCKLKATGAISPITDAEKGFLAKDEIAEHVRLACKTVILGDFEVTLRDTAIVSETKYSGVDYPISPLVQSVRTEKNTSFYMENAQIGEDGTNAKNFGLAADIGTTTVAVYLIDMDEGRVLAREGFRNPQGAYGADVISRIDKIMKDKSALQAEQRLILEAIASTADVLCKRCGGDATEIRAVSFCGNTVMEHIAAGIDPSPIANAPFIAPTLFGTWYEAEQLGFSFAKGAKIYFAPCFASYVGGDIACGMIATGLDKGSDNVLFIDIGTNGEIGLSTQDGLYFCSAAAGPALEGAHISCGMAGTLGAISRVTLREHEIPYETIGNKNAIGICGSGIIDAVAVMLDAGILDETGCILDVDEVEDFSKYVGEDWDGKSIFLLDGAREIFLTGKDVREIQLAKAAIAAGIRTLLRKAGLSLSDITSVILAGGFGSHIDPKSACRIGLIPRELDGKVQSVGNVAGAGAVAFLLSAEIRKRFMTITEKADYTELSGDAYFMDAYIDEMMFEE